MACSGAVIFTNGKAHDGVDIINIGIIEDFADFPDLQELKSQRFERAIFQINLGPDVIEREPISAFIHGGKLYPSETCLCG